MHLILANYPDPYRAGQTLAAAQLWIVSLFIDQNAHVAQVNVSIYADASSSLASPPLETLSLTTGQNGFATMDEINASAAQIATAMPGIAPDQATGLAIYQAVEALPQFAGATEVQ